MLFNTRIIICTLFFNIVIIWNWKTSINCPKLMAYAFTTPTTIILCVATAWERVGHDRSKLINNNIILTQVSNCRFEEKVSKNRIIFLSHPIQVGSITIHRAGKSASDIFIFLYNQKTSIKTKIYLMDFQENDVCSLKI